MSDPWLNQDEEEDLMPFIEPPKENIDPWVKKEMSPDTAPEVQPECSSFQQSEQHHENYELGQKGKKPASPPACWKLRTITPGPILKHRIATSGPSTEFRPLSVSYPNQDLIFVFLLLQPGRCRSLQRSWRKQDAGLRSIASQDSYSLKTSFRAQQSPACQYPERHWCSLLSERKKQKKTTTHPAISEKKGNCSSVLGSQARLAGGGGEQSRGAKTRKPRPRVPASPRPAATARCATPAPGPAFAPYLVIGGRWLEGRRERRKGLPGGSGARKGRSRRRSRHLGWKPTRPPHPALRTMGLGARGGWAFFIVGALLVLALLKVAVDSDASEGSSSRTPSVLLANLTAETTGNNPHVPVSHTNESSKSTVKPSTTPVSSASKNETITTLKPTAKPSTTPGSSVSKNGTETTLKPITSKMTTPQVSTNKTSTTLKSTTKVTSVSQNTTQMSTSTMTTTHNSSVTSVTITATVNSKENKGSKFDIGSFVGGIALTLGLLSVLYIGCKTYYSRRGIRYRTIDEHDAII
ncbi:PREDICTED: uncharacterized protein LOC109376361 [Hipposideros armiger]|uniref:Uncharacterized protein LOC109376361 n=1 Tax=Hipposideros armiger TaxID=186990 RepID=A0A8B7QI66_HIPAR|nr:PREDICTED: uncharacterized protein LOC109376361 [Hipposideros armiger]